MRATKQLAVLAVIGMGLGCAGSGGSGGGSTSVASTTTSSTTTTRATTNTTTTTSTTSSTSTSSTTSMATSSTRTTVTHSGPAWQELTIPEPSWSQQTLTVLLAPAPSSSTTIFAAVFYGTTLSTNGASQYALLKTTDGGATWTTLIQPFSPTASPTAVAVDPTNASIVYGSDDQTGIYKSTDGGQTWNGPVVGLLATAFAIDPITPTTVYALWYGATRKSTDGGSTWAPLGYTALGEESSIAIDPLTPTTIYISFTVPPLPFGVSYTPPPGGILVSRDGGSTWSTLVQGGTTLVCVDPVTPTNLYTLTQGGAITKSTDGGATWSNFTVTIGGVAMPASTALVLDTQTSGTLYTVYTLPSTTSLEQGIAKSTDGGATWFDASGGLTNAPISALTLVPSAPLTLYVGSQDNTGVTSGVFETTTGGQ